MWGMSSEREEVLRKVTIAASAPSLILILYETTLNVDFPLVSRYD